MRVAGEVGRFAKQLVEEEERKLVLRLWEVLKSLDLAGVAGGLSRQVGEEEEVQGKLEEEVQPGEAGGLLLEGVEGVQIRLVAGEEERLEGEEGGG